MSEITTIGLDLAKSVFPVHGIDDAGGIIWVSVFAAAKSSRFYWFDASSLRPESLCNGEPTGKRTMTASNQAKNAIKALQAGGRPQMRPD